jgi:hypothetical protein
MALTLLGSDVYPPAINDAGANRLGMPSRASVIRSDGKVVTARVVDDGSIEIWQNTAGVEALVASLTPPTPVQATGIVSIALFADNSVGVMMVDSLVRFRYATTKHNIYFTKLSAAYAFTAWETVYTNPVPSPATTGFPYYSALDLDISAGGIVYIAGVKNGYTSTTVISLFWRSTGGAWSTSDTGTFTGGTIKRFDVFSVSIVSLGISANVRNVVIAACAASGSSSGAWIDSGASLLSARVNESTQALTEAITYRTQAVPTPTSYVDGATSTNPVALRYLALYRIPTADMYALAGVDFYNNHIFFREGTYAGSTWSGITRSIADSSISISFHSPSAFFSIGPGKGVDGYSINLYFYNGSVSTDLTIFNIYDSTVEIIGQVLDFPDDNRISGPGGNSVQASQSAINQNHDIVFGLMPYPAGGQVPGLLQQFYHWNASYDVLPGPGGAGIASLAPVSGAVQQVANPSLLATVDLDVKYSNSAYRIEFQFATDSTFTTSVVTFRQSVDAQRLVDGTDNSGATVTFTDTLVTPSLAKGVWYYRARLVNAYNKPGPWSTYQSFSVGHPPVAVLVSPASGGTFPWDGGVRNFIWQFTDPSSGDYQSAFQIVLFNAAGATIHDSGKVVSTVKTYLAPTYTAPSKDTLLQWNLRLWDSDDTAGAYLPQNAVFMLSDPPSATITAPTSGSTVTTGIPSVGFTLTTGGSPVRRIKGYSITISKGSTIIWAYNSPVVDLASGSMLSIQVPNGILENNTSYTVQVSSVDTAGMTASSTAIPFTVAWTPAPTPSVITVSTSMFDVPTAGYVLVSWTDALRDPEFTNWSIYRKMDLIEPFSNAVLEEGVWERIYNDYSIGTSYIYKDYFVKAGYKVTYGLTQNINHLGQPIESVKSLAAAVIPQSDGYWLIQPDATGTQADVFKLSIVTADSYSPEQEESESTVIGRGRVFTKGQRLGYKGTLEAQLRNTGGTTARQKKLQLEAIQEMVSPLWLRNPFGDILKVNVSAMNITRIAGVGVSEFCDVSIPYAEVY